MAGMKDQYTTAADPSPRDLDFVMDLDFDVDLDP
jgi:hypothetical protein